MKAQNSVGRHKYKKLLKDILIFGIGSVGSKFILFLLVPLYTNFLSTEEYGVTELIYTIAQITIPFTSVVIYDAVVRFGLAKGANQENILKNGVLVLCIGSVITICLTPLFGTNAELHMWKWHLCMYIILSMFLSLFQSYLQVKGRHVRYTIVTIVETLSLALLNILFLVYKNSGIRGYIAATLLTDSLAILLCLFFGNIFQDLRKGRIDIGLLKQMLRYSTPLILNNISWWVIQSSDKLMIELMVSASALGIYTVSAKIPALINTITTIFQQAWGISATKEIESSNDTSFYANVFDVMQVVAFGSGILIIMIVKPFMSIYVEESFFEAWNYVPLLILSAAFGAISSFWGNMYGALKNSVNNMISTAISAVVNIAVNFALIPSLGIWGAVIGTAVSYAVIATVRLLDCSRFIKIEFNKVQLILNAAMLTALSIIVSLGLNPIITSIPFFIFFIILNFRTIGTAVSFVTNIFLKSKKG